MLLNNIMLDACEQLEIFLFPGPSNNFQLEDLGMNPQLEHCSLDS